MDEKTLIRKAAEGDIESFEVLAQKYQNKIYYLALRMLKNEQDAFDVSQNALIKIYHSIKHFHFHSAFSTWIYAITKNACLDFLRKNKTTVPVEDFYHLSEKLVYQGLAYNPQEHYERKEDCRELAQQINKLPREQRSILILRDIEDYAYDEIANILDLPIGTVKSRLNRARQKLCQMIRDNNI